MTRNLNRILIVLTCSLTLPHTALANDWDHGVTYEYDKATMNTPVIETIVETDDIDMSEHVLSTSDAVEDTTVGGGAVTSQKHVAYAATYEVICEPKDGQTIYARGAALIEGAISAKMANAHGRAGAAARSEVEIDIGAQRAHAKSSAALAIAHQGAATGGAGFTFAGWGASWTVTLKASGTEAHTAQLADTDATQLEQATVAAVSVNWSCEHALRIEKTSSTGNKPAEGSASASAESKATITFTTTAPQ